MEVKYAIGQKWKFLGDDNSWFIKGKIYEVKLIVDGKPEFDLDDDMPLALQSPEFWQLVTNEPTFDDLIDVTTQAFKEGFIIDYYVSDQGVDILVNEEEFRWKFRKNRDNITVFINRIKSLYKETFVINDMNDIVNINKDAVTTLQNGCIFNGNDFKELQTEPKRLLEILKGATVEQAK